MFSGSCDKGWRKILLSRSLIWQTQLQFPLPHSVEYRCEKKLLTLHIGVPLTQSPCSRSKLERGWEWLLGHITDQYKTICFCKQGCTIGSVTRASCKKKTKKTHNNQTKTPNTTENWTKKIKPTAISWTNSERFHCALQQAHLPYTSLLEGFSLWLVYSWTQKCLSHSWLCSPTLRASSHFQNEGMTFSPKIRQCKILPGLQKMNRFLVTGL